MEQKTYIGLVIKEENTPYWVAFPDFACCFSCAATLEEAATHAQDALQTHIDGMARDGYTIPAPMKLHKILRDNDMPIVTVIEVEATIPAQAADNNVTLLRARAPRPSGL